MLNFIVLQGRLTKAPELRYTQTQKPVASFTLAVERDTAPTGEKRETDFIECVAWNNTADFVHKYFDKGSAAIVTGRLQIRKWEDRDGNKRTSAEVVVDRVRFCGGKAGEKPDTNLHELPDEDGELPF